MKVNAQTGNFEITSTELSLIRMYGLAALRSARKGFDLPLDRYKFEGCIEDREMVQISIIDLLKQIGIEFPDAKDFADIDLRHEDEC